MVNNINNSPEPVCVVSSTKNNVSEVQWGALISGHVYKPNANLIEFSALLMHFN